MGMVGAFGSNGLDFEDHKRPEIPDVDCTTNPFVNAVYEKNPDGKSVIKWCPGI
jgi:hypothetical protein